MPTSTGVAWVGGAESWALEASPELALAGPMACLVAFGQGDCLTLSPGALLACTAGATCPTCRLSFRAFSGP